MAISLHLADMPDTITAQPGTEGDGKFTAVGPTVAVPCRITEQVRRLKSANGNEVTSSLKVTIGGVPGFDVMGFRYVLPARYSPNGAEVGWVGLQALSWKSVSGRAGEPQHHEVLRFE